MTEVKKQRYGAWCARAHFLFLVFILAGCAEVQPPKEKLVLSPVGFEQIPGWTEDNQNEVIPAFLKSCAVFFKKNPEAKLQMEKAGHIEAWQALCSRAKETMPGTPQEARLFFEDNFIAYAVRNETEGLFTGYYEANLTGSIHPSTLYNVPIWQRPADLLVADLGAFKSALKGQKIVGKAEGKNFVPYDDRKAVASGSLHGRAAPLLWANNPVDVFFLEIQGSGRVTMDNGETWRIGYDAQNGRDYVPIGRVLAERGEIERPVTMAKIRAWLASHPDGAQETMNQNPSAVFFRRLDGDGPIGAQGVVLTPKRSLAVDPQFVPLGIPLFMATEKQKRLVVAQDTGGAIKGKIRGDLFWGFGKEAEAGAGEMQEQGTYYVLLPRGEDKRSDD